MVSCAHLSVALRVALGASTWPGKRGFTIRRSSPTQRRNGRAFSSLTARGGGLPIGVSPYLCYWPITCAALCVGFASRDTVWDAVSGHAVHNDRDGGGRSEERRVGKECRFGWGQ